MRLVRPDGYIAFANREANAEALTCFLDARKLSPAR